MDLKLLLLCSLVVIAAAQIPTTFAGYSTNQKLKMSLYYESLCPFCDAFIKKDFYPTWVKINGAEYMEIEFVPYGNAKTTVFPDQRFNITCQHGVDECRGNVLHNCALKYLPSPDTKLAFIYCTLKAPMPSESGPDCAARLRLDFAPVRACINSGEGQFLHYIAGVKTNALVPAHKGVPWIIFNDVYNENEMQEARQNFLKFVCKKLTGNQPPQCANSYSV